MYCVDRQYGSMKEIIFHDEGLLSSVGPHWRSTLYIYFLNNTFSQLWLLFLLKQAFL